MKSRMRLILIILLMLAIGLSNPASYLQAQEEAQLPLAEQGPYGVGWTTITFVDADREDRELLTGIWYPAIVPEERQEDFTLLDNGPLDDRDAPYPLIVSSHYHGGHYRTDERLLAHLASHGFVVASIDHHCDYEPTCIIDRPLDVLFLLDQLDNLSEGDLASMIDTNRTGCYGNFVWWLHNPGAGRRTGEPGVFSASS